VPAIANAHAGTIFLDGKSFGKIYFEGGPQKEKLIGKKKNAGNYFQGMFMMPIYFV
jgi:hypothetical protein